ncbi:RING-type domain-containing protein [Mycena indigotica]|uniref:RING-type domain-containing protein n=1 Tax=Mycena indigotica TaxID=2126181 RepID=A0A8H6SLJ4_9AGAR|nr:RING-type domain-containing protein [Mycena indigotica]KAF7301843.1 RING-type domain-containing protein [Mycena indigotica]
MNSSTTNAPQLSLSINHSSSFKRSFTSQFGFDELDSPADVDNTDSVDNRRKRPRSTSSLSEPEATSSSSSTMNSFEGSSSSSGPRRHLLLDLEIGRGLESSVALGLGIEHAHEPPPRLPTPALLDSDDVEMADALLPTAEQQVRRSVDRFNAFERHISILRSSSPPIIPLPTELTTRNSPPTLPPLPLVDLALHPEVDNETASSNTPPRLDLNLPPTSLSPHSNSPPAHVLTHEAAQFRERLDSALDGLGTGDLHFEVPMPDQQEPVPSVAPLSDWPSTVNSERADRAGPTLSVPWRPWLVRPSQATATTDRTSADIRRFIGRRLSPSPSPPPAPAPPPPPRLYPRPASLAAPLSVDTSAETPLDADLVGTYLDFHRTDALEHALDRVRMLHRERRQQRERYHERLEQLDRDTDYSWSFDTFLGNPNRRRNRDWEAETQSRREASDEVFNRLVRRQDRDVTLGPYRFDQLESEPNTSSSATWRRLRSTLVEESSRRTSEDDMSDPLQRFRGRRNTSQAREADWSTGTDPLDWFTPSAQSSLSRPRSYRPENTQSDSPISPRFGTWQPRLALSPPAPSTVQPTRTTAHARAQSIPNASMNPTPTYQSLSQLRTRLAGPLRAAAVGSSNSLLAESVAARRQSAARLEMTLNQGRRSESNSDSDEDWDNIASYTVEPEDDVDMPEIGVFRPPLRRRVTRPRSSSRSEVNLPFIPAPTPLRLPPPRHDHNEDVPFNSRQAHYRRPIPHLRQHSTGGEPSLASSGVDRRHVSWEAPRDPAVSSTYAYLSALSHGFDSHALSLSDLAQTITSNSAVNSPPSPHWDGEDGIDAETEVPFSTLFGRSSAIQDRELARRHSSSISLRGNVPRIPPSLPPPDLGGDFEQTENALRSTNVDTTGLESQRSSSIRPPSPPRSQADSFTGPFRLTMQRRDEYSRRALRREPPTIPPLYFGDQPEVEPTSSSSALPDRADTRHRLLASRESRSATPRRWVGHPSSELSSVHSSRLADAERRLLNYLGPQTPNSDTPRTIPPSSSATAAQSTHRPPRYSAADMHNVLARQARLEGSRLDLPSAFGGSDRESNPFDLDHTGSSSASRAERFISQFREQRQTAEPSSSGSSWASIPRRADGISLGEVHARRRRLASRSFLDDDNRARPLRESLRGRISPGHHTSMFRRRPIGDYVRDEDFDTSYESLLTLSGLIGEARPKGTSDETLSSLESAQYQEWATADSDHRCPICLDDYQPTDTVMRLKDCRHWLHKECLVQWLKGATTCPVCRKDVKDNNPARRSHSHSSGFGHPFGGPWRRDRPGGGGGSGRNDGWIELW